MYKTFMDQMHDGVIIIDCHSRVIYANQSYYEILGIKQKNIIDMKLEDIQKDTKIVEVLHSEKKLINVAFNFKQTNVRIIANLMPVYNDEGDKIGAMSVFRDATATRAIEDELYQLKDYAEYLSGQLQQISSSLLQKMDSKEPLQREVNLKLMRAAQSDASVLITGESGSGKEVAADLLHELSPRNQHPLIKVNCASIPEQLIESEFFGYVEGAFTGAVRQGRKGKFELANQGTLFLDEVGDMPLSLQAKLLRVLQDQKIQRIGDDKSVPVNVRIIAATNVDLIERVKSKQFREDLFYRLHVIPIHLPPLRKRKVDLLDLTNDLINDYSVRTHKQLTLSAEVKQLFINYDWPGNIRELHNVLEYAFVMANDGERISKSHLPSYMLDSTLQNKDQVALTNIELYLKTAEIEKAAIVEALQLSDNNRTKAMALLNMSRKSFYHKLKHYNLTECIR
ncbi:hypothetical protein DH09_16705 [Bacillaceae bacterium JMAK1]|nr:hypothetical protein DH09_16705 [Bacillaceae bacterium JMAK1]